MKIQNIAILLLLIAFPACTTGVVEEASPHGETVSEAAQLPFPEGEYDTIATNITYEEYRGLEVTTSKDNAPGVILIHEWWGLNDNMQATAEKLGTQGYNVLAVDLYNGTVAETSSEARELVTQVDQEEALENIEAAQRYLESQGSSTVASLGFCFGGGQSMQFAVAQNNPDASIIFYGDPIENETQIQQIEQPLLGIFGQNDTTIPLENVERLQSNLQGENQSIHVYDDANHAFANPSGDRFNEEAATDAWQKTLQFLQDIE